MLEMLPYSPLLWVLKPTAIRTGKDNEVLVRVDLKLIGTQPQFADSPGLQIMRGVGGHCFVCHLPHRADEQNWLIDKCVSGITFTSSDGKKGPVIKSWFATSALKRDVLFMTTVKVDGWFDNPADAVRFGTFFAPCHMGTYNLTVPVMVVPDAWTGCGDGQSVLHSDLIGFEPKQFRAQAITNQGENIQIKGMAVPSNWRQPSQMGETSPIMSSKIELQGYVSVGSIKPKGRVEVGDIVYITRVGFLGEGQGEEGHKFNPQYALKFPKSVVRAMRGTWDYLKAENKAMVSSVEELAKRYVDFNMRLPDGSIDRRGLIGAAYRFGESIGNHSLLYTQFFLSELQGIVDQWNKLAVLSAGLKTMRLRAMAVDDNIERNVVAINPSTARNKFGIVDARHGTMTKAIVLRSPHTSEHDVLACYVWFDRRVPKRSVCLRREDALAMGCDFDGDDLDILFPSLSIYGWAYKLWDWYAQVAKTKEDKGRAQKGEPATIAEALKIIRANKVGKSAVALMWVDVAKTLSHDEIAVVNEYLATAKRNPQDEFPFPEKLTPAVLKADEILIGAEVQAAVDSAKQMSQVNNKLIEAKLRFYKQVLKVAGYEGALDWRKLTNGRPWLPDRSGKYMDIAAFCDGPHHISKAFAELGADLLPLGGVRVPSTQILDWMPYGEGKSAENIQEIMDNHRKLLEPLFAEQQKCLDIASMELIDGQIPDWVTDFLAGKPPEWVELRLDELSDEISDIYVVTCDVIEGLFMSIKDDTHEVQEALHRFWHLNHHKERSKGTLLWTSVPELVFNELNRLNKLPEGNLSSAKDVIAQEFVVITPEGMYPQSAAYTAKVLYDTNKKGVKRHTYLEIKRGVRLVVRENTPIKAKEGDTISFGILRKLTERSYLCRISRVTKGEEVRRNKVAMAPIEEYWPELASVLDQMPKVVGDRDYIVPKVTKEDKEDEFLMEVYDGEFSEASFMV